ncbi:hypothetical protein NW755_006354 [Fusarium falciforme]|uniref:Fumarylacetoacetase n=1 Tax=Fusarium falciforme TaxID=195108 RepID=A0A9W8R5S6_9HYPO|nr:hypothetical protein NW755_006354 [Fusarium falciforme]
MGQIGGNPKVPDSFFNIPLAYNGRASSVRLGDESVSRPWGAVPTTDGATYSPCQKFDYEVEMGIFLSKPVPYGQSVPAAKAKDHVFGLVLLNDWSARDVQFYEMTPLGPFNGKATATIISPWIVTMAALEEAGAVLRTETADAGGNREYQRDALAQTDVQHLHWSPFQMLAHHSSSGCGMDTGDLVGTGTLSSSESQLATADGWREGVRGSGCLYELTCAGSKPFHLTDGSELKWLEDGDLVTFEAWAGSGDRAIGFGQLSVKVIPAKNMLAERE